ncbi:hypothetical protein [Paenibacillus sp. SYP-B3998]|nr:hypothetical protein [Paenibacillus sp. SYP-B3998]
MYIVLLGLVIIVYARFIPKKEANSSAKPNVVQEIEETIEHFAAEMDEQNQALLDLFSRTKQDYEVELAKLGGRLESLEKQKYELSQELTKVHVNQQLNLRTSETSNRSETVSEASLTALNSHLQTQAAALLMKEESALESEEVQGSSFADMSMKSRYAELFELYDQGKGVEAIAKKLNMNKGEVSLILQLSRQEEQSRV